MKRHVVIGDIHGCYSELQRLLDTIAPGEDDEIIALGDIVDRGSDTPKVMEFFQKQANARCVMGNHERKHIPSRRGRIKPALSQRISQYQWGEANYAAAVAFLDTFPLHIELNEAILIHGCFEPDVALSEQRESVLLGTMSGQAYLNRRLNRPWYELYSAEKPLIVGHCNYLGTGAPLVVRDRVFGLDTGCVYGKRLTALVLPDFKIVSVASDGNHWRRVHDEYCAMISRQKTIPLTEWERMRAYVKEAESVTADENGVDVTAARRMHTALDAAEVMLRGLHARIAKELHSYLVHLREDSSYDSLPYREQSKQFAAVVKGHPLMPFLFLARNNRLSLEDLRRHFRSPERLLAFAKTIGLAF